GRGISFWISTSVGSFASAPSYTSGSISVSETSAIPVGLRSRVPAKITSSMRAPRRLLADCSPSTQAMESEIFDFPHPLGPMIAATPSPWNFSSVRSQNDLNPRIWSFFSLSNLHSLVCWSRGAVSTRLDGGLVAAGLPTRFLRQFAPLNAVPGWMGRGTNYSYCTDQIARVSSNKTSYVVGNWS